MPAQNRPARPIVSVIIAACNTAKYIGHALQSVLQQTEQAIEIIVVDDGSSDGTVEVVKSFNDNRIHLITSTCNHGQSHARNRALRRAQGEWVGVLDSDDWYAPQRLTRLLETAQRHQADLIADDLHMIQDGSPRPWGTLFSQYGGRLNEARILNASEFVLSNLPGRQHLGLGSAKPLIRRSFLERHGLVYDETLRCGEDFALYLMCLVKGARFVVTPEAHYFYRSRQGSIIADRIYTNLEHLRQTNMALLRHELISHDAGLIAALTRRLSLIEQRTGYYRIVQPLKKASFSSAWMEITNCPHIFSILGSYLPEMLRFRARRRTKMIISILSRKLLPAGYRARDTKMQAKTDITLPKKSVISCEAIEAQTADS